MQAQKEDEIVNSDEICFSVLCTRELYVFVLMQNHRALGGAPYHSMCVFEQFSLHDSSCSYVYDATELAFDIANGKIYLRDASRESR